MALDRSVLDFRLHSLVPASDCPVRITAARVRNVRPDDKTVRFVSGWGASRREANIRCRMEAAERYSAQFFGTEALNRGSADKTPGIFIKAPEIQLIDETQFRRRRTWNLIHAGMNEVPGRWRAARAIDWVAATPEISSATGWLPAGLCFLGHDRDRAAGLLPADSCGVAAGTTAADAAARAFFELVERDAVAIWWYNRLVRPQIDPETVSDPLVQRYHEWSTRQGRKVRLLDLTHDLRIPVTVAVSNGADGRSMAMGFGSGTSRKLAARHAVGELAQCESNIRLIQERIDARGEDGIGPDARALISWHKSANVSEHAYLRGGETIEADDREIPHDLAACHSLCRRHGLRFLALDLTKPAVGVAVVRVIVPGLRPVWARLAAGRLYDVPVKLGWQPVPVARRGINETPLMF